MIKVYCKDNSELAEFEASNRGYRGDIYVKLNSNQLFQLHVYNVVRLKQDFETEIKLHDFFAIDPNIILVTEVTTSKIKFTIKKLVNYNYFEYLKPINSNKIEVSELIEI